MKIIFLGTLGEIEEICPGHKKKSGVLFVKDGKKLLVDCGDPSHLETNPDYIFITHFHPDHYLGLENRSLEIYTSKICTRDLPEDLSVKLKTIDSGKLGPFKVQTFPTIHSKKVHSVALKVDNVLYTSDLIGFSNGAKEDRDKIFQGVDFVIGDGSFIKKGGMVRRDPDTGEIYGHTGIPNIVKWCEEQNVKALFITHFGEWFTKDPKKGIEKLQSLSKTLKILPARDGLEVDLSDLALEPEDVKAITPEKIAEIKTAMYLVPRHARLIYDGDKDLIVKSRKFTSHVKEEMLLIDNKFAYGYIYLKEPKKISKEDFEKLRDRHKITDKETKEWGWDLDNLYAYEFTFQKFPIPRPIRIPKGVQTFVSIDKVKFLIPKTMEDHELEFYHAFYHSCANELADLCCGAHYLIALEMLRRGLPHFYRSSCDRPIELIKDLENYDPSSVKSDRVLGDDWRILLAWYSQHYSKSGPKTPFKYSKELIIKKAVELFKEMIKRGFTFDKPENYKPGARELFEIVIKKIGKDKIPWKEELKWIPPKGWTIRDISPDYLEELPDQDLIELYRYLHRLFERWGTITEDLESANIFVGTEMWKRGIYFENRIEDDLTLATELEIVEYPTAKGFASQEIGDIITLDQVLQAFKEHPVIPVFGQPYAAYLAGRIVNEGKIPSDHDIDLIFRQKPDPRLIASIKRTLPKWLSERLHIVFDPFGPEIGYSIPIYRYGFFLVSKEEMKRGWGPFRYEELSLKPGEKFKLLKQKTGWQKNEFWRFDNLWENWASKYIDRGIHVSKKYDGRAFLVWVLKDGTVKLITEDQMRDRADQLPNVCEELRKVFKGHDVAMHVEAVCYDCGNKIVKSADLKEKTCPEIPREDTAFLTVGKITPEQENTIVLHAHDLMYFDEDLTQKPYCERFELLLRKVPKNLRYLNVVKHCIAHNLQQFRHCVKLMRTEKGSEGAFFRVCDATYPVKKSGENRSPLLAKIKNLKSIDVMVWDVIEKKEKKTGKGLGQYMYDCVFLIPCSEKDKFAQVYEWNGKCYAYIGRTYATAEKNKRGDIIEVLVGRIREYEKDGKIYFTWMFPKYREKRPDKKDPDTLDVVRKLAKVGPGYIEEMSDDEDIYVKLQLCPYYNDPRVCRLKLIFGRPRYEELSEISMLNFEGRDLQERVSIEELKVILENLKFPIICPLAMIYRCAYLKSYYYGKIAFDPKEMIIKPLDEVEEEE